MEFICHLLKNVEIISTSVAEILILLEIFILVQHIGWGYHFCNFQFCEKNPLMFYNEGIFYSFTLTGFQIYDLIYALHKKWSSSLRIFSVNLTKSTVSFSFVQFMKKYVKWALNYCKMSATIVLRNKQIISKKISFYPFVYYKTVLIIVELFLSKRMKK